MNVFWMVKLKIIDLQWFSLILFDNQWFSIHNHGFPIEQFKNNTYSHVFFTCFGQGIQKSCIVTCFFFCFFVLAISSKYEMCLAETQFNFSDIFFQKQKITKTKKCEFVWFSISLSQNSKKQRMWICMCFEWPHWKSLILQWFSLILFETQWFSLQNHWFPI